ncbi:hypothetical protein [Nocardia asteroides]|uniref:hypothetical protein n=1 Tax=Nocardia asteroides TaxID=1824 RepID=UPI00365BC689
MLEIIGTITTAVGLFIAWEKATGRVNSIRDRARTRLTQLLQKVGIGEEPPVPAIDVTFSGEGHLSVRAVAQLRVDPHAPVSEQIESVAKETRILRDMIENLREHIVEVEAAPRLEMAEVHSALNQAAIELKSELNISSAKDFQVAIGGVVVTLTGMIFGLASGLF